MLQAQQPKRASIGKKAFSVSAALLMTSMEGHFALTMQKILYSEKRWKAKKMQNSPDPMNGTPVDDPDEFKAQMMANSYPVGTCPLCEREFKTADAMKRHFEEYHGASLDEDGE